MTTSIQNTHTYVTLPEVVVNESTPNIQTGGGGVQGNVQGTGKVTLDENGLNIQVDAVAKVNVGKQDKENNENKKEKTPEEIAKEKQEEETAKSEKESKSIRNAYKKTIDAARGAAAKYFQYHFDFIMKDVRSNAKYVSTWRLIHPIDTDTDKNREYFNTYDDLRAQAKGFGVAFYTSINDLMMTKLSVYPLSKLRLLDDATKLNAISVRATEYFNKISKKISTFYIQDASIMDIIFDSQFLMIYVLKVIIIGSIICSLFLGDKLFSEMYMKAVYANGEDPPNILIFIGIFIGLNLAFVLFLLTILVLLMFVFKGDGDDFIINGYLIKNFLKDYSISTIFLLVFAIIIGMTIQNKRYFRYKTEGLRGIRALREIVMYLAIVIFAIPFFAFI